MRSCAHVMSGSMPLVNEPVHACESWQVWIVAVLALLARASAVMRLAIAGGECRVLAADTFRCPTTRQAQNAACDACSQGQPAALL